jgi:cell wall-associated NlpC family hydrolase
MPRKKKNPTISREEFVGDLRSLLGTPFGHQGRGDVLDCGGIVLFAARKWGFTDLEVLGYARYPTDGEFERLLGEHTDFVSDHRWPFEFTGEELRPGDLMSFDYGNGEGTRHVSFISGFDRGRYRIIEAQPDYGVCEHAIAPPFVKRMTTLKGWSLRRYFGD